jgi:hypothetical protein
VHPTQTRRWPDGSELCGTGVIGEIGGWGRWLGFDAAMALDACARPTIALRAETAAWKQPGSAPNFFISPPILLPSRRPKTVHLLLLSRVV